MSSPDKSNFRLYARMGWRPFLDVSDMQARNRIRPKTSLQDRLQKFADDARAAAESAEPGRDRDVLIDKARSAEAMAGAARRLEE